MSNTFTILSATLAMMTTCATAADNAVPAAEPAPDQPGLVAEFRANADPVGWGAVERTAGKWNFAGGDAVSASDNAALRYNTTRKGSAAPTAMDPGKDWVFSMTWRVEAVGAGAGVFELSGARGWIVRLTAADKPGEYVLLAGDGRGGERPIGKAMQFRPGVTHHLVVHYRATSKKLDFWVSDALVRGDLVSRCGDYGLGLVQIRGGGSAGTKDTFGGIRVGMAPKRVIVTTAPKPPSGWYAYSDRYNRWQKNRPLLYGALHNSVPTDHLAERIARFKAAGLNTLIWWKPGRAMHMFEAAAKAGIEWACGSTGGEKTISAAMKIPGNSFIMIGDEPGISEFPHIARMSRWARDRYPDTPVFTNISIMKLDHDHFVQTCKPDVFSFDHYPLTRAGETHTSYLFNLAWARQTARSYRIPFWMFLQAYGRESQRANYAYRVPGAADMRFLIFTFLAHGGTGVMFYHYYGHLGSMVYDPDLPNPGRARVEKHRYETSRTSRAWHGVRDAAPEALNLGRVLVNLRSVGEVTYVGNGRLWDRSPPTYSRHNRKDNYRSGPFKGRGALRSVKIVEADNMGALVAFFQDRAGQEYFRVVNLQHGKNVSKTAAARRVRLTFGPKVKTIQRLNRLTGRAETLKTQSAGDGRTLEIQLPGGTGDLFKWDNGKPWALRAGRS